MTNNIHDLLHILRQRNITYLDADSYNTIDQEDLNNTLTEDELLQTKVWSFQLDVKIQIRNIALFVVT